MKYILHTTLFLLSLSLFACGGDSGACSDSPLLGRWVLDDSDVEFNFKSNCTGTESSCKATFEYSNVSGSSGLVSIKGTSSSVEDCFPLEKFECNFTIDGDKMGLNCGDGVQYFTKK
jgi:hypothetical protein